MAKKVNIKELARRYTTAIFDLAKSENKLDKLSKDLEAAENLIDSSDELQKLLSSPLLGEGAQVEIMKEIGKANKFDALTINFLLIVARNGRLANLKDIITAFRERIAEENGEITVEVTSAEALSKNQIDAVAKDLSKKTGKIVKLKETVKPEIIGGLIIKIGPKMFDYSIKSRLNKLKSQLKQAS